MSARSRKPAPWCAAALLVLACAPAAPADESAAADTGAAVVATAPDTSSVAVLTPSGLGPLRIGMTLAEARTLPGGLEVREGATTAVCDYVRWRGAPAGVLVMIEGDSVARVDVDSSTVATEAGARVGDSEARIDSLYPGRVTVSPHKYTDGHYLTVSPSDPADGTFRLIFETDRQRVLRYRAGRLPSVEYVEGCA